MRLSRFAKIAWASALFFGVSVAGLTLFLERRQNPLPPGGDFELEGAHGRFKLESLRGHPVALYFGFTGCPDVCPNSWSKLSAITKELPAAEREALRPVLVSVDYRSDNGPKVDEYVKFFVPNATGAAGTKPELEALVARYGTGFRFEERKDTAMGYTITHGTSFYLLDRQGRIASIVAGDAPRAELKAEIQKLF